MLTLECAGRKGATTVNVKVMSGINPHGGTEESEKAVGGPFVYMHLRANEKHVDLGVKVR